ncbi:Phosphorelay intermediate protein YPD1 [Candida viswanathii]|uniref:Phosphorelay intermediate protein YPD1 n=1 Tax=Candida viswanathii TaxID=5486 RepID=A0A367YGG8_9ASCO|nr:Phosphorelay intermediate protein YPD1 [Candida viswanathii]
MPEEKLQKLQDSGLVEWSVFSEIVAMDEDEEGFSYSLFETFVSQVEDTFKEIDEYLKEKDLVKLSSSGHFLKGSAAALGLAKIANECERIQNYGHKINFDNFQLKDAQSLAAPGSTTAKGTDDAEDNTAAESNDTTGGNGDDSNDKIPDESNDDFWIALIQDALSKARDLFDKSRDALEEYYG